MLFQSLVVTNEQAQFLEEKTSQSKVSSNCGTDIELEELQLQSLSKLLHLTL